eukprot:6215306-Alexandrium_andersonii.AAC.1
MDVFARTRFVHRVLAAMTRVIGYLPASPHGRPRALLPCPCCMVGALPRPARARDVARSGGMGHRTCGSAWSAPSSSPLPW